MFFHGDSECWGVEVELSEGEIEFGEVLCVGGIDVDAGVPAGFVSGDD